MPARRLRPKRLLTLALLAVSLAAAVWWVGHVPYDPLAIYRPVPASASLVGRHLRLPARWDGLMTNPFAPAVLRTVGVEPELAAAAMSDADSRAWFEKLAGREGTLAYLPGGPGDAPAWMAASQLGGAARNLRWQLALFRLPGFERLSEFPGRAVWRVVSPDLDPELTLAISFGEGVLLACLSANPLAIAEVLAAYDGRGRRLLEAEESFARLATEDDRSVPDRLWIRDESEFAPARSPGIVVDVPVLAGAAISMLATTPGADLIPEDRPAASDLGALARRLGAAPCAVALLKHEALAPILARPELRRDVRHALQMVADVATDRVAVVAMDGDLGGRLTVGLMSLLGTGLRVSTLMLATPVPDEAAAAAAIQRVLDASNARYRAAFVLKPVLLPGGTLQVLESAGGDEWVDQLPLAERPAWGVLDGWLLASSNLGALQKLAQAEPGGPAAADWAARLDGSQAVSVWLDLGRSGQEARNALATWSMIRRAQQFLEGEDAGDLLARLNTIRSWIDACAPLGTATARLGRRGGATTLAVDLGLSGPAGLDRMPAP